MYSGSLEFRTHPTMVRFGALEEYHGSLLQT
jgi:hypothetical protein